MTNVTFITPIIKIIDTTIDISKRWVVQIPHVALVAAAALAVFPLLAYLYKKIQNMAFLPFDKWSTRLGFASRQNFDAKEISTINSIVSHGTQEYSAWQELLNKNTPQQMAQKLYAYIDSAKASKNPAIDKPQKPSEWISWMVQNANKISKLRTAAHDIFWGYENIPNKPEEEEKALHLQGWATELEEKSRFFNFDTYGFSESVFQTIQNSPRLAYTILFNFAAPFVMKEIWDWIQDSMPESVQAVGDFYMAHKGKIALAMLAAIGLLYYQMKKEKGIFINLTEQWKSLRGNHRGLDLVPSFGNGIQNILTQISSAKPGDEGSNILFYKNSKKHRTFKNWIGEALAEMTATGRIFSGNSETDAKLCDLQIWELDFRAFLSEYHTLDKVYSGWKKAMARISREKNVLVVIKDFSQIQGPIFEKAKSAKPKSQEGLELFLGPNVEMTPAKLLSDLFITSLRAGSIRCLIEVKEEENKSFESLEDIYSLFTSVRAPEVSMEELEKLFIRLYSAPDRPERIPPEEITKLFTRLKPAMDVDPQQPSELMMCLQNTARRREIALRQKARKEIMELKAEEANLAPDAPAHERQRIQKDVLEWEQKVGDVQKAEKRLKEVKWMKKDLLQKMWERRSHQQPESPSYMKALLMIENVILPLYSSQLLAAKSRLEPNPQPWQGQLVETTQKRFTRLYGPGTEKEFKKLEALPALLNTDIKGQEQAIGLIYDAVDQWRTVPPGKGKPLVLFFAGPTGIGKSHTAMRLAYHLKSVFGIMDKTAPTDESNVIRIRLETKQSKVFGWENKREEILERVFAVPLSTIIFEEWDKMDPAEMNNLLEWLDDTPMYKGSTTFVRDEPTYVDRRSTIVIFTSNIAAEELSKSLVKEEDAKKRLSDDVAHITEGIKSRFSKGQPVADGSGTKERLRVDKDQSAESFLSRINAFIPFHAIPENSVQEKIEMELSRMVEEAIIKAEDKEILCKEVWEYIGNQKYEKADVRVLQSDIEKVVFNHLQKTNSVV